MVVGKKNNIDYSILIDNTDFKERLVDETMHALLKASQMKDNDTGEHINRLNEYSKQMSIYIYNHKKEVFPEITPFFINRISKVAAMHDIGKIGIPDYILTKPGKLDDDEFNIMKEHTINGAFILSELAGKMARDIALFHHEKWDGSGYPYNLKGDQIPLVAQIVAIADVYDALRMKRSYKQGFTQEKSVSIIRESAGSHFNPDLVEIFIAIQNQFDNIFSRLSHESKFKKGDPMTTINTFHEKVIRQQ